jgi:hypothetical protein
MKTYKVYVGVELGYRVPVEAKSREEAVAMAVEIVEDNYYVHDDCELTSISTCELWTEVEGNA